MKLAEAISAATAELKTSTPEVDAKWLMADLLGCELTRLTLDRDKRLSDQQLKRYREMIVRRSSGEPVAYITGSRGFWSIDLKVAASTLIPRADTECLVDYALQLPLPREAKVLDLGTGTGAIALALGIERPNWTIKAVDKFAEVVALAKLNQEQLQLTNVLVFQSDWFGSIEEKFDLIISNPPYVDPQDPHLTQGDVAFEPKAALVSDKNGLADIQILTRDARHHLVHDGVLLIEHGHQQGLAVCRLMKDYGYDEVETRQDFGRNDRFTTARWRGQLL